MLASSVSVVNLHVDESLSSDTTVNAWIHADDCRWSRTDMVLQDTRSIFHLRTDDSSFSPVDQDGSICVRSSSFVYLCLSLDHRHGFRASPIGEFLPDSPWIQLQLGPVGFLTCCSILIVVLNTRVHREEIELKKKFGEEWINYASMTKRFIPGLI